MDLDFSTDLESVRVVPHKGVAFAKFARASVALRCMEAVTGSGTLGGMRVKCMLAEPKAAAGQVHAQGQGFGLHDAGGGGSGGGGGGGSGSGGWGAGGGGGGGGGGASSGGSGSAMSGPAVTPPSRPPSRFIRSGSHSPGGRAA
jgi:hypothetical protein